MESPFSVARPRCLLNFLQKQFFAKTDALDAGWTSVADTLASRWSSLAKSDRHLWNMWLTFSPKIFRLTLFTVTLYTVLCQNFRFDWSKWGNRLNPTRDTRGVAKKAIRSRQESYSWKRSCPLVTLNKPKRSIRTAQSIQRTTKKEVSKKDELKQNR